MAQHLCIAAAAAAEFDPPEPLRRHLQAISGTQQAPASMGAHACELQLAYWQLAALIDDMRMHLTGHKSVGASSQALTSSRRSPASTSVAIDSRSSACAGSCSPARRVTARLRGCRQPSSLKAGRPSSL